MASRTTLYDRHLALGARMFKFGGWEMPLWYSSIGEEHMAVRNAVGIFDVSHMGKILVEGDAEKELERLLTRSLSKYDAGRCAYACLLDDEGRILDDLIATKIDRDDFFVVCNASKRELVLDWMGKHRRSYKLRDLTTEYICLAVQGPKSAGLMHHIADPAILNLKRYHGALTMLRFPHGPKNDKSLFAWAKPLSNIAEGDENGVSALVTRTGYTGEDGFEIFVDAKLAGFVWDELLRIGEEQSIKPVGLGARDTLRLEMCYLLSGHDFDGSQTPLEADAEFAIDWNHDFVGKDSLERQRKGEYSRLIAFMNVEKGIPRDGYPLLSASGERIGRSTSGTMSPSLKTGIGMGYVPQKYAAPGTNISYEVGARGVEAIVVEKPFLKK